jgi:hypothetical protein
MYKKFRINSNELMTILRDYFEDKSIIVDSFDLDHKTTDCVAGGEYYINFTKDVNKDDLIKTYEEKARNKTLDKGDLFLMLLEDLKRV